MCVSVTIIATTQPKQIAACELPRTYTGVPDCLALIPPLQRLGNIKSNSLEHLGTARNVKDGLLTGFLL